MTVLLAVFSMINVVNVTIVRWSSKLTETQAMNLTNRPSGWSAQMLRTLQPKVRLGSVEHSPMLSSALGRCKQRQGLQIWNRRHNHIVVQALLHSRIVEITLNNNVTSQCTLTVPLVDPQVEPQAWL
eukprot:6549445-Karenia_brevis.AAC.1